MSEAWREFLWWGDQDCPRLTGRTISDWAPEFRDFLTAQSVLVEAAPSETFACQASHPPVDCDLHRVKPRGREAVVVVSCSECGAYPIPPDWVRCWEIDWPALLGRIFRERVTGSSREIVPGQLWCVGRMKWSGTAWSAWFGRGHALDQAVASADVPPRSLLFVPRHRSGDRSPSIRAPLDAVVTWANGRLAWDDAELAAMMAPARDVAAAAVPKPRKTALRRATRMDDIQALTRELTEHVRSARSHARHTFDRDGVASLLPRPSQKELAQHLGITESRVSRSLNDEQGASCACSGTWPPTSIGSWHWGSEPDTGTGRIAVRRVCCNCNSEFRDPDSLCLLDVASLCRISINRLLQFPRGMKGMRRATPLSEISRGTRPCLRSSTSNWKLPSPISPTS